MIAIAKRAVYGVRPKLLVTGSDELIGANLAVCLAERFDVVGLPRRRYTSLAGCRSVVCDWRRPEAAAEVVRREQPQSIVHCGLWSHSSWDTPDEPLDASRDAACCRELLAAAHAVGARLTLISSDTLFAGPQLFHDEQSANIRHDPRAEVVWSVEQALDGASALIVRTHAFGWSPAGGEPGWAERIWQSLAGAEPLPIDPQPHATPILVTELAELLQEAWNLGLSGVYHLAGAERVSCLQFAQQLAAAFRLEGSPMTVAPADGARPFLPETALDTRRARGDLQRPMPSLCAGLEQFVAQRVNGHRARLQARAQRALEAA